VNKTQDVITYRSLILERLFYNILNLDIELMVTPLLTSLDVDVWALAFAAFVTLVSVALAGLSAAHITQWDRVVEDEDSGWVSALAERTKHKVESTYPRLTRAISSSQNSKVEYTKNSSLINNTEKCKYSSTQKTTSSLSTPPRRR
jgi:hypothetical protein